MIGKNISCLYLIISTYICFNLSHYHILTIKCDLNRLQTQLIASKCNGHLLSWFGHIYKNQIKTLHMGKIYKFIKFIVKYNKNTIYGNELLIF